ncbi:retrovirus-related pol polyprotein from transposon TNT 1-94 [Tanacetum coccineum]
MYRIDTRITQTRALQLPQTSRNTNPRVSTSTGVIHRTNVSRPTLMSNQMKEMVMPNNSQVTFKKMELEDHHRISSISKKTKSVTVCNDSLNSRTLYVNAVCADCGKCVFNSNHDACVSKYLKDVNAITKKPNVVPISSRKPKDKANKSVATPHKKTNKTGNLKLLCNFVEIFLGTVHFGNDQFALILGYGDLIQGNVMIKWVYYVKGLNHNLFSVGQFCDTDLEVAFWKSTCYVRDLQGNDLLTGSRGSDLYTISLQETSSATPLCLMAKSLRQLKHVYGSRRLYTTNFDYINLLSKKDIDETPEVLKDFLKMIQRNLQAQVITVRTNIGTKFLNKTLHAYFKEKDIEHQTSTPRTPEQNDIVERRNRTLVKVARTMLSASKLPLFFWAEAIATACYTQNRSRIIPRHEHIPYHIINGRKPSLKHLHIFGCTCYITRDGENLNKMKEKEDPCILELSKASDYDNSGPEPQLQKTSDHNRSELGNQDHSNEPSSSTLALNVSPLVDINAPSLQELEFLLSPSFEQYFTAGNQSVSKSLALSDNSKKQDTQPITNIQPTT